MKWYQLDLKEVLGSLQTSEQGLSETEAKERLEKYGPNKLPEGKGLSRLKILLHQFTNPLIYILMVTAVVTVFLGEYIDTGVIVAVLDSDKGVMSMKSQEEDVWMSMLIFKKQSTGVYQME